MYSFPIGPYLSGHVFAFIMILSRLGCVLMLFPGISEAFVTPRIRMLLAMSISFLLMEPLMPRLPTMPPEIGGLMYLLGSEILIGLFFGTVLRFVVAALETAGTIVALQTGLSNATVLNPALALQSPLASAFLSLTGVTVIFITGMDHFLFRGMIDLYDLFPPGGTIVIGDMTQFIIQTLSSSFLVGIELATPFLVLGLLLFISMGLMQKLLPQVQIFLVVAPVQIWGGLTLFSLTVASIITVWLKYCDTTIGSFFAH